MAEVLEHIAKTVFLNVNSVDSELLKSKERQLGKPVTTLLKSLENTVLKSSVRELVVI